MSEPIVWKNNDLELWSLVYSKVCTLVEPCDLLPGTEEVSLLVRCPGFRGCNVRKQGVWDGQMCPVIEVS